MSTQYASEIEEIAQSIFATMLDGEVAAAEGGGPPIDEELFATVQITGSEQCCVVLGVSHETARQLAATFLHLPPSEVAADDHRDVVAELVNMIGGNLKSLLPGPCFLSLPTVVSGSDVDVQVAGARLTDDVRLAGSHGPLRVRRYVAMLPDDA
jgi:chemotaxis protein CheX